MQTTPQQMKAMVVDEFGGPDKLTLHPLPVPAVDAGEVLIRIEIAGGNIWDAMEREGELVYNEVYFPRVLGSKCAGTIAAVGEGGDQFAVGDAAGLTEIAEPPALVADGRHYQINWLGYEVSNVRPLVDGVAGQAVALLNESLKSITLLLSTGFEKLRLN